MSLEKGSSRVVARVATSSVPGDRCYAGDDCEVSDRANNADFQTHVIASLRTPSAPRFWNAPLAARLLVLERARQEMASSAQAFAEAISPALMRTTADTLVAEVLPLLDACRFLEHNAPKLLRVRKLKRSGRPLWLTGVYAEIRREPLGRVLVIGPANFPLFLPGVQTLQALAAGNTVVWKPGTGGGAVARLFARALWNAGLPHEVLTIAGEDVEEAEALLAAKPDKVVFTGSSATGRRVLEQLAPHLIPATLELSGTDAVIVLESADLERAAKAIAFGLRLNGSAVCMCPRRLLATAATTVRLLPLLSKELAKVLPVALDRAAARLLPAHLLEAEARGATVVGTVSPEAQGPLLVHGAQPDLELVRVSYFAPVLAMMELSGEDRCAEIHNDSPYGLTASIFGDEGDARALAKHLRAGSVLINDLIAPTADPRLPFGGRGQSGYGVTRGAEGLLEMTAVKVVQVRRNRLTRHYEATTARDAALFADFIRASHAARWTDRLRGWTGMMKTARRQT